MQNPHPLPYPVEVEDFPLHRDFPLHLFRHSPRGGDISSVHTHPFWEIGCCCQGKGLFFLDGEILPFSGGDVFVVAARQLHKAQSLEGPSRWIYIYADLEALLRDHPVQDLLLLSNLNPPRANRNAISGQEARDLADTVQRIAAEYEGPGPGRETAITGLLCYFLAVYGRLSALPGSGEAGRDGAGNGIFRLAPALQHISAHFREPIEIEALAELCYMSPSTLRRAFASCIRMSPAQYIATVRVKTSLVLLASADDPILAIAGNVGYRTLTSFNRTFRDLMGMTPSDYRSQARSRPAHNRYESWK